MPVKVAVAIAKTTEAWRRYDELVDLAIKTGDMDEFHNSFRYQIEEAAEAARDAEAESDKLRAAYLADANPGRWYDA
jgi:hypothetical protein